MSSTLPAITGPDRRRLGSLLATPAGRAWGTLQTVGELEDLLDEAFCVEPHDVPESLVTMNTTVKLVDRDSGARRIVTLVFPQDAGESPNDVSITEPLGVALIGCRRGDVVQFQDEAIDRRLEVAEILYQPERADAQRR